MLITERKKLSERLGGYISLGITEDGQRCDSISVPWESTSHAFSMKLPDVYITPSDLEDRDIMKEIRECKVVGCYIFAPLSDYGFLSDLTDITDLNIYRGYSIRALDFLAPLDSCAMLFLEGARLHDINVILDHKKKTRGIFEAYRCLALYDCEVEELSRFESERHSFSELILWQKEGADRERWKVISASKKRYYDIPNR